MPTFHQVGSIFAATITALILVVTGAYVLYSFHTNWGLIGGLLCILLALACMVPVQLKTGAKNLKDAGKDVHDALVVIVPTQVFDSKLNGDRMTDPQSEKDKI